MVSCGISTCFQVLSPCLGQVAHALLTRPPLEYIPSRPKPFRNISPFDLHVLSTPPAFVLSQDQTLMFNPYCSPLYLLRLAKASAFSRLTAFYSMNSDCSEPLPRSCLSALFAAPRSASLSSLCIVFKVRVRRISGCSLVQRKCYYIKSSGACQAFFSAESAPRLGFTAVIDHNIWYFQVKNG